MAKQALKFQSARATGEELAEAEPGKGVCWLSSPRRSLAEGSSSLASVRLHVCGHMHCRLKHSLADR